MNLFKFVDAEKATYPVSLLCRALKASRSGYYAWKSRPPSKRAKADAVLTRKIERIHQGSRGTYGAPRVHAELRATGVHCGRKRVARLMRGAGLRGSALAAAKCAPPAQPRSLYGCRPGPG